MDPSSMPSENEQLGKALASLCSFLHYSQGENKRLATESKGKGKWILLGRAFEDAQLLEALEELRIAGKITLQRKDEEDSGGESSHRRDM